MPEYIQPRDHMELPFNKLCVIVPAYNEAGSLKRVITALRETCPLAHIVIINDGSTDETQRVAESLSVAVVNLPTNLGIGGSVQAGLKYALEEGFTYALQVDGDGQHDPKYIPVLFQTAVKKKIDLVIGSRYIKASDYKASWLRRLGIIIFSWTIKLATDVFIADSTSGFRVFGPRSIAFLAKEYPLDFPEPESIVRLLKHGYRVEEVPVEMKPRLAGISSVDSVKALYLMLSIPLSIAVDMFRPNNPEYDVRS